MSLVHNIRSDLPQGDYLVQKWKSPASNANHQNQIRLGSSLRVRPGEAAVFLYPGKRGEQPMDVFHGPADLILQKRNLPRLASVMVPADDGDGLFPADVFFVQIGQATQLKWEVEWVDTFDSPFPDTPVPVSATGKVIFSITDVETFAEVQGLEDLAPADLVRQIRPQLIDAIRVNLVALASASNIPPEQIGARLTEVGEALRAKVGAVLGMFGVKLSDFLIESIELKQKGEGLIDPMRATRDLQLNFTQALGAGVRSNFSGAQGTQSFNSADEVQVQRDATPYAEYGQILSALDRLRTALAALDRSSVAGTSLAAEGLAALEAVERLLALGRVEEMKAAVGSPDLVLHEVAQTEPSMTIQAGQIVRVLRPGATRDGKVIRRALVSISSGHAA